MKNTRFTDGSGWTNEFHIYNLSEGIYIYIYIKDSLCRDGADARIT